MKTMHLFAGVGGGLLADLILGHEPLIAVEWDKYACQILRERVKDGWFTDMQVYEGDVRLFTPSEYAGRVDCIHAGFPCQDISVAGKKAGVGTETRSGLYRQVLRIADTVRPQYIFLENVAAILANRNLGVVLGDLSTRRYSARWICVRASDVGANHGRDRWWLLAKLSNADRFGYLHRESEIKSAEGRINALCHSSTSCGDGIQASTQARRTDVSQYAEHNRDGRGEQFSEGFEKASRMAYTASEQNNVQWGACGCKRECVGRDNEAAQQNDRQTGDDCANGCRKNVPNTSSTGLQRGDSCTDGRESPATQRQPRQCRGNSNGEIKSGMGSMVNEFSAELVSGWWEQEPNIGRVTDVTKDRASQLKALGNAQVPLQAAVAFSILYELMQ